MSSRTLETVGTGILIAAAIYFSGGTASAALLGFSLGSTAAGLILGPEKTKTGDMRPDEFQMNQSAEDSTVPVIFGTTRISANFIRVDLANFTNEPLMQQSDSGGKGGGAAATQQGYIYYVPIDYGICMGQIDYLRRIVGSPGLQEFFHAPGDGLDFTDGAEQDVYIHYVKTTDNNTVAEGGHATFFPGSYTQGSDSTTADNNHRGFCWVSFSKYQMTGSPNPISLLFEIQRLPKVLGADGEPLADFPVRASSDPTTSEWLDANPAACAWELLTNQDWGKGDSPDLLNEDDFRAAAKYFEAARLGISTAVAATSAGQFMDRLRELFGLTSWWDGTQQRCLCIFDRTTAYNKRTRISKEDVTESPTFTRPAMAGTMNEVLLTFTNRENNWQSEVARQMDIAHAETVGCVRAQSVDGAEIGTRRAAELLVAVMLRQVAYPSATASIKVRRTYSNLHPGSFCEFLWDEWRDTGLATTFWRVLDIDDDDTGNEGITINLVEDLYATAIDGEIADGDFTAPVPSIDQDDPLNNQDLVFGDQTGPRPAGSLRPVVLWEPNSWVSQMQRRIYIGVSREKTYVQSVTVGWRYYSDLTVNPLGSSTTLPINGKLVANMPAGRKFNRGAGTAFRIQLEYPEDVPKFIAATGQVQSDADNFEALTGKLEALLLIDSEIFRIGNATEVGTGTGIIECTNYMRGELGSVAATHAMFTECSFMPLLAPAMLIDPKGMPTTEKVVMSLQPNTIKVTGTVDEAPADGLGIIFPGTSIMPFAPMLRSVSRVGSVWTVQLRPRVWLGGAGWKSSENEDLTNYVTDVSIQSLRFQKGTGGSIVTVPAKSFAAPPFPMPADVNVASVIWVPDDGSRNGGILTVEIHFDASPGTLLIWTVFNGFQSAIPLTVPTP